MNRAAIVSKSVRHVQLLCGVAYSVINAQLPFSKPVHRPRRTMDLKDSSAQPAAEVSTSVGADQLQERASGGGKRLSRLQLAALIFCVWTAVGVFLAMPDMLKGFHKYALIAKVIEAWAWSLLTPVVLLVDRKVDSKGRNIVRLTLIFLLLSIPFSLTHTYLAAMLLYPIPQIDWSPLRNHQFAIYYFISGWVTYCAIIGILLAFKFYNRFERSQRSLLEWRLNALRLHLEPHFLFNALNAISSEMVKRPHVAQDMIADLGALLRLSLDSKDSPEIGLAQELTLLDHYLSIQKIRFGKRIDIKVEIEPDALSARVPSMLLQPLVENAIRHGVEGRRSGATIFISASRAGNRLQLRVADNGRGLPAGWKLESSTGHGLRVTLERLIALYPECGGECLTIGRRAGGGTEVTVRLPFCRGN
jgi:two-component system LytT family sensor kinase